MKWNPPRLKAKPPALTPRQPGTYRQGRPAQTALQQPEGAGTRLTPGRDSGCHLCGARPGLLCANRTAGSSTRPRNPDGSSPGGYRMDGYSPEDSSPGGRGTLATNCTVSAEQSQPGRPPTGRPQPGCTAMTAGGTGRSGPARAAYRKGCRRQEGQTRTGGRTRHAGHRLRDTGCVAQRAVRAGCGCFRLSGRRTRCA